MTTCQRNIAGVDRTLLIIQEKEIQEIRSSGKEGIEKKRLVEKRE